MILLKIVILNNMLKKFKMLLIKKLSILKMNMFRINIRMNQLTKYLSK
jgi:hypothetical protein